MPADFHRDDEHDLFIEFVNDLYRKALPQLIEKLGSIEAVEQLLSTTEVEFKRAICSPFQEPNRVFRNLIRTDDNPEGLSQARLSKRYMVSDGQVSRWLNQGQRFGFENQCIISAAEDIEYPPGHVIAISAYEHTISMVAKKLGSTSFVTGKQYLTAYHFIRCQAVFRERLPFDETGRSRVARHINAIMQERFPGFNESFTTITTVLRDFRLPLVITLKQLPYGWF